jgi:hypothetical protein
MDLPISSVRFYTELHISKAIDHPEHNSEFNNLKFIQICQTKGLSF